MRYKISFEFETDDSLNGQPQHWLWSNLLENVEDGYTKIDFDSLALHKQEWKELTDDDD